MVVRWFLFYGGDNLVGQGIIFKQIWEWREYYYVVKIFFILFTVKLIFKVVGSFIVISIWQDLWFVNFFDRSQQICVCFLSVKVFYFFFNSYRIKFRFYFCVFQVYFWYFRIVLIFWLVFLSFWGVFLFLVVFSFLEVDVLFFLSDRWSYCRSLRFGCFVIFSELYRFGLIFYQLVFLGCFFRMFG